MKKSKFLFILLPLMAILGFILRNQYFHPQRESILNSKEKFDSYLYKYDDFKDELPVITLEHNHSPSADIISIDKTNALEDIDYLFSLLKYGYSGYEFFGGDKKFKLVKSNIVSSIENSNQDPIPIEIFIDIIYSKLNFIQDSHFFMDKYNLCDYTYYYSSREFNFHKDANGYFTYIDDEIFYLKEVNNNHPEDYIYESLDEEGNIIYNLGILSNTDEVYIPINLLLESSESIKNVKLSLFEYKPIYEDYSNSYNLYEIDNIPILDVNSLCRIDPRDNTLEKFINDSASFRNEENIIIDLRNNTGGNLINVKNWFKGFTGVDLKQDIIESGLYTNTSVALSKNKFELKENQPDAVKFLCLDEVSKFKKEKYFPGWSPIQCERFQPVETKTNIIVLLDKTTSSAAEFFIYYLKKLDNVTLVGTNTKGCMLTGNPNLACLPNSKIHFYISHKLYMQPDFTNIEGLGFYPDLWVKPEQSLDRVIKYIQNK